MAKQKTIELAKPDEYNYYRAGEKDYKLYRKLVESRFPRINEYADIQSHRVFARQGLKRVYECYPYFFQGSNVVVNSAMNMAIRHQGRHVATQAELEYVRKAEILSKHAGFHTNTGLVLYSDKGPNKTHAKDLIKQLDNPKLPVYIPAIAYDLKLVGENIGFEIVDPSKIVSLPRSMIDRASTAFDFINESDIDPKTGFAKSSARIRKGGDNFSPGRPLIRGYRGLTSCDLRTLRLDLFKEICSCGVDLRFKGHTGGSLTSLVIIAEPKKSRRK